MNRTVDVILVNWNSGRQLETCLQSLAAAAMPGLVFDAVVVDNASSDGSESLLQALPFPFRVIKNSVNRGFAAACNQGARSGSGEYILFLNPDVTLNAGSLAAPLEFMGAPEHDRYGICGIQLLDEMGRVWRSCCRLPTPRTMLVQSSGLSRISHNIIGGYVMADWSHDASRNVDHVIGAFYLVRRSLFERLDGFDEQFFVYLEDLDFSLRTHRAGFLIRFVASAHAHHVGGGSSAQAKPERIAYSIRSRVLYARKHFGAASAYANLIFAMIVEPVIRLAVAAGRCSTSGVVDSIRAYSLVLPYLFRLVGRSARQL